MAENKKITGKTTIAEVVEKFPKAAPILLAYGFHCAGCPAAQSETVEQLAQANQLDLKQLLESLNKALDS